MNSAHSQNHISNSENFPEDTQGNNISSQVPGALSGANVSPGPGAFPSLLAPGSPATPGFSGFPGAPTNVVPLGAPPVVHPDAFTLPASNYHVTSAPQTRIHSTSAETNSVNPQPTHHTFFFYQPPNDFRHYYVKLKEIPYDTIPFLLSDSLNGRNIQFNENEFIFYYRQQYNNRFYQASCEIVPHLLINHCLNKNFLGIEFQQNMGQENLAFTAEQKENLEYHLKQRLSQYLLN